MERLRLWIRGWMFQFYALRGVWKRHGQPYTLRDAWKMGACGRFVTYAHKYGGTCPITGRKHPGLDRLRSIPPQPAKG